MDCITFDLVESANFYKTISNSNEIHLVICDLLLSAHLLLHGDGLVSPVGNEWMSECQPKPKVIGVLNEAIVVRVLDPTATEFGFGEAVDG